MSDVKFSAWTVPESPVTVEYSLVVIEEIRHEVAEGFQRLSRGGIEVGGVLYGTQDSGKVRILAMRPIACEHARGPGFLFSDKDRIALHEQLVRDREDPRLEGLVSVGWFLSHTRSEITLSESDLEIYSIFFPAPWQVAMVVRPGRGGSMRAGFFVRENDGTVRGERSYLEFNFPDRLAGILDRPADRSMDRPVQRAMGERVDRRVPSLYRAESPAPPAPAPSRRELPSFATLEPLHAEDRPRKRKWPWLVAWAAVLIAAAVLGLRYWMPVNSQEPLSLAVLEHNGELQVQWNPASKPVARAASGSLQILDGPDSRTIVLTPAALASGKFTYQRKSGDIEVRLTVESASGGKVQEASRFLGRPPAPIPDAASADLSELQKSKDAADAEVRRLQAENEQQAQKIQELQRMLKVLETKLGIDKQ